MLLASPRHTPSPSMEYRANSNAGAGLRDRLLIRVASCEDFERIPLPSPPLLAPARPNPILSPRGVEIGLSPVLRRPAAKVAAAAAAYRHRPAAAAAAAYRHKPAAAPQRPKTPALIQDARRKLKNQEDTWLRKGAESPFRPDRTYLKITRVVGRCFTVDFRYGREKGAFFWKRTDIFGGSFQVRLTKEVSTRVLKKNEMFLKALYERAFSQVSRRIERENNFKFSTPLGAYL